MTKKYKIQSVLFSTGGSYQWTMKRAQGWLKKRGYKYSDVDKKAAHIRFQQLNPDYVKKNGYRKFRNHDFGNGISVVMVWKGK